MEFADFFINVVSGGVVGGLASFIASKYFLEHNNKVHRPNIAMSDKVIKTNREDGTPALLLKVINRTDKDISKIVFDVEGIKNLSPSGSIPLYQLTHIARREILYIKEYNKNDSNAHYAHRTRLFITDGDILEKCKTFEIIRISVYAECPYYGTSTVLSKDYNVKEDILSEQYHFNTGDSLSCSQT
ncbi:hypothetical protein MNB_SM-5-598 [hydrothermal vent metagenome]|uniref:Uncharacterized protein n=1 Tax=hydrothermal vent metagenome TaxID=652676 RepID=A0A1W1CLU8_9ZZZZ